LLLIFEKVLKSFKIVFKIKKKKKKKPPPLNVFSNALKVYVAANKLRGCAESAFSSFFQVNGVHNSPLPSPGYTIASDLPKNLVND